jgi:hypothetical protein
MRVGVLDLVDWERQFVTLGRGQRPPATTGILFDLCDTLYAGQPDRDSLLLQQPADRYLRRSPTVPRTDHPESFDYLKIGPKVIGVEHRISPTQIGSLERGVGSVLTGK